MSTLHIRPWPDPVIDRVGVDPRSPYVERYWLGVLGPTSTWLIRRFAAGFDGAPSGFQIDLDECARALGLGGAASRRSAFDRAIERLVRFELARRDDAGLDVRRRVPPLSRRLLRRLPEPLQSEHSAWVTETAETPPLERVRVRARRLALSLVQLGEDREATERQLLRWRFHPVLAKEATAWAMRRFQGDAGDDEQPAPPPAA